mmetsp:Transcript_44013/g.122692  ORF Transcript_44013/g.122692 Transcript_44013/m.122692 type:complete len:205 (-) Transcript_44013:105-719(-)
MGTEGDEKSCMPSGPPSRTTRTRTMCPSDEQRSTCFQTLSAKPWTSASVAPPLPFVPAGVPSSSRYSTVSGWCQWTSTSSSAPALGCLAAFARGSYAVYSMRCGHLAASRSSRQGENSSSSRLEGCASPRRAQAASGSASGKGARRPPEPPGTTSRGTCAGTNQLRGSGGVSSSSLSRAADQSSASSLRRSSPQRSCFASTQNL